MESQIVDLFKQFGWIGGVILAVLFLLTNHTSTAFFTSLIDHRSKPDNDSMSMYSKVTLLKLSIPSGSNGAYKILPTICYSIVIGFFLLAGAVGSTTLNLQVSIYSAVGIFILSYFLCDLWFTKRTETMLELEGDANTLIRTYQRILADMKVSILSFDINAKQITGYLNGNELSIKINPIDATKNSVTFTRTSDFNGVFFYSGEFKKLKRALIDNLCCPETT